MEKKIVLEEETSEPPKKKQRTESGFAHPTAMGVEVDPTLKKKNPNNKMTSIVESMQYKAGNYRGVLQEYFQKQGKETRLIFDTHLKPENGANNPPVFICTCKAGEITATGEANSKKQASKLAAFAAIQKLLQISPTEQIPDKADTPEQKQPNAPKKKENKRIIQNKQYLNGNFRGALLEYLARHHPGVTLEFKTELRPGVFIATCRAVGGENQKFNAIVGTGHAASKKNALHFSALEFMLKFNLLTVEQHSKIHRGKKAVAGEAAAQVQVA